MNVNYVIENKNKLTLNMIMNAYNLEQIVDFPTRVSKNKGTSTDDTLLDRAKHNCISVYPTNISCILQSLFLLYLYIYLENWLGIYLEKYIEIS